MASSFVIDAGRSFLARLVSGLNGPSRRLTQLLKQRREMLRVVPQNTDVYLYQGRDGQRARLRDISATGMGVKLGSRVSPGTQLAVLLCGSFNRGELGVLRTRVVWCRAVDGAFEAGLACIEEPKVIAGSWLQRLIAASVDADSYIDRRRATRVNTHIETGIQVGTVRVPVQVSDLSTGGARLSCNFTTSAGDEFELVLPDLDSDEELVVFAQVLRVSAPRPGERYLHVRFLLNGGGCRRLRQVMGQMERVAA